MTRLSKLLILIVVSFLLALLVDLSGYLWEPVVDLTPWKIPFKRDLSLRYGLDLQGGVASCPGGRYE